MAAPFLSIGLPVYNGEAFLVAALDSILGQSFSDFSLVVSDNGSDDATEEICREYAARDGRIRYLRNDVNRGAAWNYNNVFAASDGKYFRWAAADDMLAPECLAITFEAIRNAPDTVALAYPRALVIDAAGRPLREQDDRLDTRAAAPHKRFHHVLMNVVFGNPMFGIVRRKALARTRLHGSYPSADWVLLSEIALVGEIWQLPEQLFLRREHEGMSRQAHATSEDLTAWLCPGAPPVKSEHARLFREFLKAVGHAKLDHTERAATYAAFSAAWARRHSWLSRRARAALGRTG